MTTFLAVFGLLGWLSFVAQTRRLDAARLLEDAQREHLMLVLEDHAKLQQSHDALITATARLVVASKHLTDSLGEQTIIVPPSGGMVA
jgi:hypothetical protein